ncbi:CDP-2,3-bis-(O-geranylgeranyl)-sn-glycerol synthase [Methanohalophilus halophilus]|nr:CDP-2,3-bis-(O-geranylgeranyl)-sn-glycerol synthase [Methanohalophilus halophilus]
MIIAVWLMLPAYLPSPFAALLGGGRPIDGKRTMGDGRRILGDGKTIRGFVAGSLIGIVAGILQTWIAFSRIEFMGIRLPPFGYTIPDVIIPIAALSIGSLLGDLAMSFVKRRIDLKRGAPLPIADQLDFVAGAWILTYLVAPQWFVANFTLNIIIVLLILTPLLHIGTNIIGYVLGIKKEPW